MRLLASYLFGYAGDPAKLAPEFFRQAAEALDFREPMPVDGRYQIGLVRDRTNGGLFVALIVGNSGAGDDSLRTMQAVEAWFGRNGITPPHCETSRAKWPGLQATLGDNYEIVAEREGPVALKQRKTTAESAAVARRRAFWILPTATLMGGLLIFGAIYTPFSADPPSTIMEWALLLAGALFGALFLINGWGLLRFIRHKQTGHWIDRMAKQLVDDSAGI